MLKKNSIDIKLNELDSWLAVCGYILPRSEQELLGFNKLHDEFEFKLTGSELDSDKIWKDINQTNYDPVKIVDVDFSGLKMAARGLNSLPENILDKMRKNQMINRDVE